MANKYQANSKSTGIVAKYPPPQGWCRAFYSLRARLLVWYFLLTACRAIFSIQTTRQIYCDDLKARSDASLVKEVARFKLLEREYSAKRSENQVETAALFDKFLASYAPTGNEYIITLINDEIYKYTPIYLLSF